MKNRILNNYQIKLLSFVVAVGLWFYVYQEHHPIMVKAVPVPVRYSAPDKRLKIADAPKELVLKLRGPRPTLDQIGQEDLSLEADLRPLDEGTHNVKIKITNKTIARILDPPSTVKVVLERRRPAGR